MERYSGGSDYVYCADETKEAVKRFIESDIPAPDALGYELLDENEEIMLRQSSHGRMGRSCFSRPTTCNPTERTPTNSSSAAWTIITENNDDLDKVFASLTEGMER